MEGDGVDRLCKSLGGLVLKQEKAVPATPTTKYALPAVVPSYVPPTPCTPYVPPKVEKENTPINGNIDKELKTKFNNLILRARKLEGEYNYTEALRAYVQAMHIRPGDMKLERKIGNLSRMTASSAPSPSFSSSPSPSPSTPPPKGVLQSTNCSQPLQLISTPTQSKTNLQNSSCTLPNYREDSKSIVKKEPLEKVKVEKGEEKENLAKGEVVVKGKPEQSDIKEVEKVLSERAVKGVKTEKSEIETVRIEKKEIENVKTEKREAKVEKRPLEEVEKEKGRDKVQTEKEKANMEQEQESRMSMQEQPNGYFRDTENNAYVLKSKEEEELELSVSAELYNHLFDYQREGIKWMWGLFLSGQGGILGDDMGLGKTMQVVGFLGSMIRSGHISKALVVMPVSVLEHWKAELEKWGERIRVKVFHGSSKKERETSLSRVKYRGGVLLTTYGMVLNQTENLCSLKWDYIVFDEGHKIKDPLRQITKKAKELRAINKILLTGTPIQNNLKEMWALFDWACDGKLLGNEKSFKIGFENPIVKGLDKHASREEKQIGETVSASLMALIRPYFLRRDKKTLFGNPTPQKSATSPNSVKSPNSSKSGTNKTPPKPANVCTTRKNDLVVWLTLSEPQTKLYLDFLGSDEVRHALNQTQSHLSALTRLKQICTHPALLTHDTSQKPLAYHQTQSAKIAFLAGLIPELRAAGHRLLIFSQYTTMLDIIQSCIVELGCKFVRIDGSINSTAERERRIKLFNKDRSIFCFLLTTGAGALGINLTSADRVVIFDPSWNTNDNQAVDRVYRVGQTRDVVIYRLILCGTIDEKMYRKQVYKAALQGMMKAGSQYRYFSKQDLSEMFTLDDTSSSATQQFLAQLHDHNARTYPYLDKHIQFLHNSLGIVGVSHHDLLFSENPEDVEPSEEAKALAARAQSSLFVEPSGTRRRKPPVSKSKKPRAKVAVLEEDYDDYEVDTGTRVNPVSLSDEEEGEKEERRERDEEEEREEEGVRRGREEEQGEEEEGDREWERGEGRTEQEGGEEEKEEVPPQQNPYRRLRRRGGDSEDENEGKREEEEGEIQEDTGMYAGGEEEETGAEICAGGEEEEEGSAEIGEEEIGDFERPSDAKDVSEYAEMSIGEIEKEENEKEENEQEGNEKEVEEEETAKEEIEKEEIENNEAEIEETEKEETENEAIEKEETEKEETEKEETEKEETEKEETEKEETEKEESEKELEKEDNENDDTANENVHENVAENEDMKDNKENKREYENEYYKYESENEDTENDETDCENESEHENENENENEEERESELEESYPASNECNLRSCAKHQSGVAPFLCLSCSCFLSDAQASLFHDTFHKAELYHKEGKLKEALRSYMDSLIICDDNIKLHAAIISLQVDCMDL